jgi:hypothetical protein
LRGRSEGSGHREIVRDGAGRGLGGPEAARLRIGNFGEPLFFGNWWLTP